MLACQAESTELVKSAAFSKGNDLKSFWEALNKYSELELSPPKRGDSIKPGVERSGNPRIVGVRGEKPAKAGDSRFRRANHDVWAIARSACLVAFGL